MKKKIFLFLAALILVAQPARAEKIALFISYKLPTSPDLASEATRLEANALSQRNIEIQSCANGGNQAQCEKNAEISFRLRILAIPGAKIQLSYVTASDQSTGHYLFDLTSAEAINPQLDQNFSHLTPPNTAGWLGVTMDTDTCQLSDSYSEATFASMICTLVQSQRDDSSWMWLAIDKASNGGSVDYAKISFLINHGANANVKNTQGVSALGAAARYGLTDVATLLLDHGANIESRDDSGDTALNWAATWGQVDAAELLVNRGANVNTQDDDGTSPLSDAASVGSLDLVRFLLNRGAFVDSSDLMGQTPLMLAVIEDHPDIVSYLLANGASVNSKNHGGETALKLANEMQYPDIAKILQQHGGTE